MKLKIKPINEILQTRGLESGGKVQKFIDSEVLRRCDPYVPMDTGSLKRSGITGTVIGSGKIIYTAPYARKQYYSTHFRHKRANRNGLRGAYWFERMKADQKDDILRGVKRIVGGNR